MAQIYTDPDPPGTAEFFKMAQHLMSWHNLTFPTTLKDAMDVYVTMTAIIEASL